MTRRSLLVSYHNISQKTKTKEKYEKEKKMWVYFFLLVCLFLMSIFVLFFFFWRGEWRGGEEAVSNDYFFLKFILYFLCLSPLKWYWRMNRMGRSQEEAWLASHNRQRERWREGGRERERNKIIIIAFKYDRCNHSWTSEGENGSRASCATENPTGNWNIWRWRTGGGRSTGMERRRERRWRRWGKEEVMRGRG